MILVGRHVRVPLESAGVEEEEDGCTIRHSGFGEGEGGGDKSDDGEEGGGMLVVVKKKEIDRGKGPSSPNEPVSSVTKMDLMVR